ncbi:MAG: hypothetical protein V4567_05890 [Pseudomonadota bacterium]
MYNAIAGQNQGTSGIATNKAMPMPRIHNTVFMMPWRRAIQPARNDPAPPASRPSAMPGPMSINPRWNLIANQYAISGPTKPMPSPFSELANTSFASSAFSLRRIARAPESVSRACTIVTGSRASHINAKLASDPASGSTNSIR